MAREKTKQVPIGFTERHREMIEFIMKELGYHSLSSVVQQAVVDMYQATASLKSGDGAEVERDIIITNMTLGELLSSKDEDVRKVATTLLSKLAQKIEA